MSKPMNERWNISKETLEKLVRESYCYSEVLMKMGMPNKNGWYSKKLHEKIDELELDCSHFVPFMKRRQKWDISKKDLVNLVRGSYSYSEVLRKMGKYCSSFYIKGLKGSIREYGIDCSHFHSSGYAMVRYMKARMIPLESVLIEGSNYGRTMLKRRLIDNGMLKNECGICGRKALWEGKTLVLILDHINGINNDNRKDNLRLVCPNCESQLNTHAGKNKRQEYVSTLRVCPGCGKKVTRYKTSGWCRKCYPRKKRIPNIVGIQKEVKRNGMAGAAITYGRSQNTIRRWISLARRRNES